MSNKYPSQIHKLDKWSQTKHFSHEIGAGKGSHPREQTADTRGNFSKGYDNIKWGTR